jgi:hypothetical protein
MDHMNKEVERRFLEAARDASTFFPAGDFVPDERPDFIVPIPGGTLGIEVTELCRRPEIERAERLSYVLPKAKLIYSKMPGAKPINVNPAFLLNENISVNDLAQGLAEFTYRHRDDHGTFSWDRCDHLPRGYDTIAVFDPLPHQPDGEWIYNRGFRGFIADKELLEAALSEKNPRVPEYRKKANQVWLVIINDQWRGAGEVYVRPEDVGGWKFDFAFHRVFLFSRLLAHPASVIELQSI